MAPDSSLEGPTVPFVGGLSIASLIIIGDPMSDPWMGSCRRTSGGHTVVERGVSKVVCGRFLWRIVPVRRTLQ